MDESSDCKGCRGSVRLSSGEVDRIIRDYFGDSLVMVVDEAIYADRLATCSECPDLLYGTTCRHCGCLVAVRAKLADKACAAVPARWESSRGGDGRTRLLARSSHPTDVHAQ